MINIGVLGYGYWGPNLVRNFLETEGCTVSTVVDINESHLVAAKRSFSQIKTFSTRPSDIFNDTTIDAVVIATHLSSHYELCKQALLSDKHVLVEKPITGSVETAIELFNLAEKKKKTLLVDHTSIYTSAFSTIKDFVFSGAAGDVRYIDSIRINLGLFQSDINVLWDLGVHDLAVALYLIKEKPASLNAVGGCHTQNNLENIAYLTINFDSGRLVHINSSWSSPVKIRHTLIGGDKKMIVYNDLEPTEKIKIYDTGYHVKTGDDKKRMLVDYRVGDIYLPKISQKEALAYVAEDFKNSILHSTPPLSDGKLAIEVVRILEASDKSIKNDGKNISLKYN